jgi:hypothetical protein
MIRSPLSTCKALPGMLPDSRLICKSMLPFAAAMFSSLITDLSAYGTCFLVADLGSCTLSASRWYMQRTWCCRGCSLAIDSNDDAEKRYNGGSPPSERLSHVYHRAENMMID